MKRLCCVLILLLLFSGLLAGQELLFEGDWQYYALRPSALTGEKGVHIFPSSPNSDDLQYSMGSASLNSAVVAEMLNANQGSLEFWIRPNNGTPLFVLDVATTSGANRIIIYIDSGQVYFELHDKDNTVHYVSYTPGFAAGTWYHLVGTWDFLNDAIALYEAGTLRDDVPSAALSSDSIDTLPSTMYFGQRFNGANILNATLTGRILDRPLSSAEVTALYAAGSGSLDSTICGPDTRWLGVFE